ncbi:unnamed protein product [Anisakis simplex]|uniref:Uncharacterized protein n=1 Tax=Anisakis simplex TaxID=6269 RepID=A0A0M3JXX3_ANISI|nr:unnamed protein product [Anisakis simplex]
MNRVNAGTQTENQYAADMRYGYNNNSDQIIDEHSPCTAPSNVCTVGAQTTLPPINSIAFQSLPPVYEQNDFYCQTSPLDSTEFGTQMCAGDMRYLNEYIEEDFDENNNFEKDSDGICSRCSVPNTTRTTAVNTTTTSVNTITTRSCSTITNDTSLSLSAAATTSSNMLVDASIETSPLDFTAEEREFRHAETHVDEFDFDEFLRNIQTQTNDEDYQFCSTVVTSQLDALTQTANDFIDDFSMTDRWNTL